MPILQNTVAELNSSPKVENPDERFTFIDSILKENAAEPRSYFKFDSSTNFTVAAFNSPPYIDPTSASLSVASQLMEQEFIHHELREKLGSYGGWAIHYAVASKLFLRSYRDPNCQKVLEVFDEMLSKVEAGEIDEQMVERAIIKVSSESPTSPLSCCSNYFQNGITYEEKYARRLSILKTTKEQIILAAAYLKQQPNKGYSILGNESVSPVPNGFQIHDLTKK